MLEPDEADPDRGFIVVDATGTTANLPGATAAALQIRLVAAALR